MVYYLVYVSSPLDSVLSHTNAVHVLKTHFFMIHLTIIFQFSKYSLPGQCTENN
jgi:hypothetical protein